MTDDGHRKVLANFIRTVIAAIRRIDQRLATTRTEIVTILKDGIQLRFIDQRSRVAFGERESGSGFVEPRGRGRNRDPDRPADGGSGPPAATGLA